MLLSFFVMSFLTLPDLDQELNNKLFFLFYSDESVVKDRDSVIACVPCK